MNRGEKVLDAGCGFSCVAKLLETYLDCDISGIDIQNTLTINLKSFKAPGFISFYFFYSISNWCNYRCIKPSI